MKVLLVDDDYLALEGLCQMLRWENFGGELAGCATDEIEAVSIIEGTLPDVVISDIKMPRMDGINLASWLHHNHREIRIILLSGHSEFEYAQKALQYRVTDYILKPITRQKIAELENRLAKINCELQAKNEVRRLAADDALRDQLLAALRKGDAGELSKLMLSGDISSALLQDSDGTLGATILNYVFDYQNEIGKDKPNLTELKKASIENYWSLRSPKERIDYLFTCCQNLMAYSENQKGEYEQPIAAHCIQVIQEHFSDPSFNISQLADMVNLSLPYLSTVFKQVTGQTISSYLSQQRLLHSQNLLQDISIPIRDVCTRSGYEDPHYFARFFKKQTGMTPSEYRNLYSSRPLS